MTVTLDLKPELEHELLARARERGVSLAVYLHDIVSEHARVMVQPEPSSGDALKLPILRLGAMSSLHRRDIYDDAR